MKVIIKKTKEIKDVSFGYAVNFLFPQNLALIANKKNIKLLKKEEEAKKKKTKIEGKKYLRLAKKLDGKEFIIKVKGGKQKLFGSVTKKNILQALPEKDKAIKVLLEEPIKKLGEYKIKLKINKQLITIKIKVKK